MIQFWSWTAVDWLTLFVGLPIGCVLGGLLGWLGQRLVWRHDLPYEERVRRINKNGSVWQS